MSKRIALSLVLFIVGFPAIVLGAVTLTTVDGVTFQGELKNDQLELHTEGGEKILITTESIITLKTNAPGIMSVTLFDGTTVTGKLHDEIIIQDDMLGRSFQPSQISEIIVKRHLLITEEQNWQGYRNRCPLRIEIPVGPLFSKKRRLNTGLSGLLRCKGTYVPSLMMRSTSSGSMTEVTIRSSVVLAAGQDKTITLLFILAQGDAALATARSIHRGGDEGQNNKMPAAKLRFPSARLQSDAPEPTLRFEVTTEDRS